MSRSHRLRGPSSAMLALASLALLGGCPTPIDPNATAAKPKANVIDENDPRVVRDGEDLYAAEVVERAEERARPHVGSDTPPPTGLGTGKPDESNGVCRLYAPKLPDPQCCEAEFGFDAEQVQRACGLELYLGESFYNSCGYYFHRTGVDPQWFRASFTAGATPKEAVQSHDRRLARITKNDAFASEPVPGVDGALWSAHNGIRWAFLPGWDRVRLLSWSQDACSDQAMAEVLRSLIAAKQPPQGARRLGLVPKARS